MAEPKVIESRWNLSSVGFFVGMHCRVINSPEGRCCLITVLCQRSRLIRKDLPSVWLSDCLPCSTVHCANRFAALESALSGFTLKISSFHSVSFWFHSSDRARLLLSKSIASFSIACSKKLFRFSLHNYVDFRWLSIQFSFLRGRWIALALATLIAIINVIFATQLRPNRDTIFPCPRTNSKALFVSKRH